MPTTPRPKKLTPTRASVLLDALRGNLWQEPGGTAYRNSSGRVTAPAAWCNHHGMIFESAVSYWPAVSKHPGRAMDITPAGRRAILAIGGWDRHVNELCQKAHAEGRPAGYPTYLVTFERIGRHHGLPTQVYRIIDVPPCEELDDLADQIGRFADQYLASSDYEVTLDPGTGTGKIGGSRFGTFTFTEAPPEWVTS